MKKAFRWAALALVLMMTAAAFTGCFAFVPEQESGLFTDLPVFTKAPEKTDAPAPTEPASEAPTEASLQFITKKEAQNRGWTGGSLEPYAPGCSIGGDYFGNYEGLLPKKKGRTYTECDIGTKGKSSRGAKRIVFSNDGLIYYSGDHYDSFTLLYGEE